jgi:hypothetical protein
MMTLAGKEIIGTSKFKFSNLTDDQKESWKKDTKK